MSEPVRLQIIPRDTHDQRKPHLRVIQLQAVTWHDRNFISTLGFEKPKYKGIDVQFRPGEPKH